MYNYTLHTYIQFSLNYIQIFIKIKFIKIDKFVNFFLCNVYRFV